MKIYSEGLMSYDTIIMLWDYSMIYIIVQDLWYLIGLSCKKTSVKQDLKYKECSNFQMSFLHLSQTDPPVASSGQEWKGGTDLGPVDLSSDVAPMVPIGQELYKVGSSWPGLRCTPSLSSI